ncbi:DUF1064 domain-containing protein [bacterium 210820-DFI.6.37]|nr:DUF1064 domain-containing protein [bacterium 210820-DFI.6.37]
MNIDNITDLPEKYRRQAELKLSKMNGPVKLDSPKKYRNQPTTVNGIKFDSKKEAARFVALLEKQKSGEISDLKLQVGFTLAEGFTSVTGEKTGQKRYVADFTYRDINGNLVVEDVKSEATRKDKVYLLKKSLMAERYGIFITEV